MDVLLLLAAGFLYFIFSLWKTEFAALGVVFFVPLYLVKVAVFGVPFTFSEVTMYGFFAGSLLKFLYGFFSAGRMKSLVKDAQSLLHMRESFGRRFGLLFVGIGLLLVACFITLFWTPSQIVLLDGQIFQALRVALGILKGWMVAPLLFVVGVLLLPSSNKRAQHLLYAYTASAGFLAAWALWQMASGDFATIDGRASGPFESANYLALYLAPAVLYILILLKQMLFSFDHARSGVGWRRAFLRKNIHAAHPELPFLILLFLAVFLAFIGTKSYAAILAVFAGALFYFGLEYREYRKHHQQKWLPWKFVAGFLILAFFIGGLVFSADPAKWQAMFRFDARNSSSVRLEVYDISWNLIRENWFTGIGMGSFPAEYQMNAVRILGHEPYEWNMLHPHNLFFAFWLNTGLLGLAAFLFIVGLCAARALPHIGSFGFKPMVSAPKLRVVGFSLLLIILVHGFFDTPFFKNDLALLFWLIVLMIMMPTDSHENS